MDLRLHTPMLADPVESFFAGFNSIFVRLFFALVALIAGAAVCHQSLAVDFDWALLTLGSIFIWGDLGAWFPIGLLSLLLVLACGFFFIQERSPKANFFVVFSASVVYFSPICFGEGQWIRVILIYVICAALYWILPRIIQRLGHGAEATSE